MYMESAKKYFHNGADIFSTENPALGHVNLITVAEGRFRDNQDIVDELEENGFDVKMGWDAHLVVTGQTVPTLGPDGVLALDKNGRVVAKAPDFRQLKKAVLN